MLLITFALALREIRRHLLRSFLTVLGIVIGVAAVVTMVTLGKGATSAVSEQISSLGADLLQIRPGQGFGRGGGGPPAPNFDMEDAEAISRQVGGVRVVAPQVQTSALAVHAGANWQTTVVGADRTLFAAQAWRLTSGRLFTPAEEQAGKTVCIVGATVVQNLLRGVEPTGQQVRVGDVSCEVIGALAARGQGGFQDQDDVVVMPLKAVQRRFTGARDVRNVLVAIDASFDRAAIQSSITALLRERRHLSPGQADNFNIFDTRQIAETLQGTTRVLTAVMGAVAAVSLVVGGIGIMNIMLVSVTERTREIGIRLAIGALGREVLLQFLVEAIVLSCIGGVIGLVLALGCSVGLARLVKVPFLFDGEINLAAFAVSAFIGVVFGYFPARRAAALNPIDALRHE